MRIRLYQLAQGLVPCLLFGATLAGCAGLDMQAAEGPCLGDTPACIGERTAMVRAMSSDQARAWIGQTPGRGTVASGVRLFAYQNVRDKLSCSELVSALQDLDAAKQVLADGPAPGQTMLRHNDIKAMTDDVRAALTASKVRRCGAQGT
jgi:hypothetical protein